MESFEKFTQQAQDKGNEICPPQRLAWILLAICCFLLLVAVIVLATLYGMNSSNKVEAEVSDKTEFSDWPAPSSSPLGVYQKAAVAADNGLCSEIGRNALMSGGNAVDAAIATAVCIGVMNPHSSGLGGGHFMTIYNSTTKSCLIIDAREEAPQGATMNTYKNNSQAALTGWLAIGVSGELHGLWKASQIGGSLPWASLLQPSIRLLQDGYPVSPELAKVLQSSKEDILKEPTMRVFVNNQTGLVFETGDLMKRPVLARTLSLLANSTDPARLFYSGSIATKIVQEFKSNGGLLTLNDFQNYQPVVREPIVADLPMGLKVCAGPPPSSGSVAAAIIKYLAGIGFGISAAQNLSTLDSNVLTYHRLIESMKFAYASRSQMGDSSFGSANRTLAQHILSDKYAMWIRRKITDKNHDSQYYNESNGRFLRDNHGTAHISVLDNFGNAVSMTSTINLHFGAKRRSMATGIIWNGEMGDFSTPGEDNFFNFTASESNYLYPGKRPMSSMSPIVITDKETDQVRLVVGGAGGSRIISSSAYVALRALWFGETIKEAIDAPRLHDQWLPAITLYDVDFPTAYVNELKDRGHNMIKKGVRSVITGIFRSSDGTIYANSDYRKESTSYTAGY